MRLGFPCLLEASLLEGWEGAWVWLVSFCLSAYRFSFLTWLLLPWWTDEESAARDYFRVQDAGGRWLWLFRSSNSGDWFVHGEWS